MRRLELDSYQNNLLRVVSGSPRILGYKNAVDWFEVKKYRGKLTLFLSLYPLSNKGKKVYAWRSVNGTNHYAVEQFDVAISKKQVKKLIKLLNEKLLLVEEEAKTT
jgi:hypothetical protein